MDPNISDNRQNSDLYSQTKTQGQRQASKAAAGTPWESPLGKSSLASASAASSVAAAVTTNIGAPLLAAPGPTPAPQRANEEGVSFGSSSHTITIKDLNYTPSEMTSYLEQVFAKNPNATIKETNPPVAVKDLLKKGTAANDILNYLNAPADPPVPLKKLNIFSPSINTGSLSPSYTISHHYHIKVKDLHTPGSSANAIYTYLNNVSQLITNAKAPKPNTKLTPLPTFKDTAATSKQISAAMSTVINNLPAGDTKTIFQFLHDHGGEEGLAKLPPDTVVIPASGSKKAVTVADLRKTGSPAHAVVVEHNSMRLITDILIKLKSMLNQMQEWAVGNLKQLQEKRQAQVQEQEVATNKQVADNNKNIQQIQAAAAAAAEKAKWGFWGDIIGIVVSVVAIVATVALTLATGGTSDAALPAEVGLLSGCIAGVSIAASTAMAGVSIAELASGNQFLSNAMAKLGKDMMDKLGPIGGPIVAALIIALTIALTKGAGTALASAGVNSAATMAATMASVTIASTLLGSSNIIAIGVADCFHNPKSEVAQLVSAIVQMVILLAVAIAGGKMMMSGGRLLGSAAKDAATVGARAAATGAEDAEDVEMTERGASAAQRGADAAESLPESAVAARTFSDEEAVEETARAIDTEAKTSAAEEKKIQALVANLSKLLNKLKNALASTAQQIKQAMGDTNIRSLAERANRLNAAAGAASGAATGIAQGLLSIKQHQILDTQADIQTDLAEVEGLISMLKTAIKLLDDNSTQFQTMLNQISTENGHVMDPAKKMDSALSRMLQKLESV